MRAAGIYISGHVISKNVFGPTQREDFSYILADHDETRLPWDYDVIPLG